jgi:DNA invertase Pin-like site-specific DNA recombinase
MIHFLEEHSEVRILLCEKTDRLYRNFKDYVTIDELDLTLIFVKEGSVLNKQSRSHEKFIHGIKVLMAKNYIDNLSEETKKGLLEKAEEGEFPAYAPLGYLHDKADKTIEIDPERAPIIREMFEQYATSKFSLRRLEVLVAQQGLTTRKGNRLARSSVANILKNPFYTGDFLWNGKQYQGKHPAIIDKELFQRVRAVSGQRNDTRATSHRFAYSGFLKCAHCGCSITAEIKKGRYIYYHCTFDKGSCGGLYVREEELERQFEGILSEFHFSEIAPDWIREALRQNQQEKAEFHNRSIGTLNVRYAKLQNRIDQIYLDKLDGGRPKKRSTAATSPSGARNRPKFEHRSNGMRKPTRTTLGRESDSWRSPGTPPSSTKTTTRPSEQPSCGSSCQARPSKTVLSFPSSSHRLTSSTRWLQRRVQRPQHKKRQPGYPKLPVPLRSPDWTSLEPIATRMRS